MRPIECTSKHESHSQEASFHAKKRFRLQCLTFAQTWTIVHALFKVSLCANTHAPGVRGLRRACVPLIHICRLPEEDNYSVSSTCAFDSNLIARLVTR